MKIDKSYLIVKKKDYLWRTSMGNYIYLKDMSLDHLRNILGVLRTNKHFPNYHIGLTKRKWIRVICDEIVYKKKAREKVEVRLRSEAILQKERDLLEIKSRRRPNKWSY